jgi:hypothetical protein
VRVEVFRVPLARLYCVLNRHFGSGLLFVFGFSSNGIYVLGASGASFEIYFENGVLEKIVAELELRSLFYFGKILDEPGRATERRVQETNRIEAFLFASFKWRQEV